MPITTAIAERVAATSIDAIPANVVDYPATLAMSALVDGGRPPQHRRIDDDGLRAPQAGVAEASVLGGTPLLGRARRDANGTFAHATEYEDDSFPGASPATRCFRPCSRSARAWLERRERDRSIRARLRGAGADRACVPRSASSRRHGAEPRWIDRLRGRGRELLGLDATGTTMAIASPHRRRAASAIRRIDGAYRRDGFLARNGLTAALLAAEGSPANPMCSRLRAVSSTSSPRARSTIRAKVLTDWGVPYRVLDVGIKHYPCCYHLQRIIERSARATGAARPYRRRYRSDRRRGERVLPDGRAAPGAARRHRGAVQPSARARDRHAGAACASCRIQEGKNRRRAFPPLPLEGEHDRA